MMMSQMSPRTSQSINVAAVECDAEGGDGKKRRKLKRLMLWICAQVKMNIKKRKTRKTKLFVLPLKSLEINDKVVKSEPVVKEEPSEKPSPNLNLQSEPKSDFLIDEEDEEVVDMDKAEESGIVEGAFTNDK